jgi:MoxR-like ATPase
LILATRPERREAPAAVRRYVRYGASPRALQALEAAARAHALLEGRFNVAFVDVRRVAPAVLRHRLRLNVEADVRGVDSETVLASVLSAVAEDARPRLASWLRGLWSGAGRGDRGDPSQRSDPPAIAPPHGVGDPSPASATSSRMTVAPRPAGDGQPLLVPLGKAGGAAVGVGLGVRP